MDSLVYPALRKRKINFTPIKRITLGFFIAGLGKGSVSLIFFHL